MIKGLTRMASINLVLDGASACDNTSFSNDPQSLLAKVEELSLEEKLQTTQFSRQIDLSRTDIAASYGSTVQRQSADIARKTLESVRSMHNEKIGSLLVCLVAAINSLEGSSDNTIMNFFRKFASAADDLSVKRENAEIIIDQIERKLEGHKLSLRKDIIMLNNLYNENWELYKALTMYIKAGEQALDYAQNTMLPMLEARARITGQMQDSMNVDVYKGNCEQFESQLHQLRLTRTICLQSAPQLIMLRRNNEDLLIKLQSSIVNTIPLWKQKVAVSTAMQKNLTAAKGINSLNNSTNNMLQSRGEMLRLSLAESVKQAQKDSEKSSTIEIMNSEIVNVVSDYINTEKQGFIQRENTAQAVSQSQTELNRIS